jgi:hypothetical protein
MQTDPTRPDGHDLDGAVEQAITACDGDARAAVRALIVANDFLHAELARIKALISRGFARGKLTLRDLP